ncbi:homoserine kinase [Sulfobacillus thermosulfidooxidans]|uniref:homoserine kinase n=1 Tax=Sulfobacillus thermosulfidooxidans TaxID=28034 RepID=UPI00096B8734|nr:homoserine kinase [Sulfobacillus thermosulfidooxidans]OLZ09627.1 homoserine kinase [Sulfobacillus thermosulfidooxidans]OLZ16067.1 homoserine kinase [Sulfobacillus thermosulfidooxidans]OLZ18086.1 homoserine kinase [Sulfobacillus thermosulfidooxidans]
MLLIQVPATSANLGSGLDSLGLALSLYLKLTYCSAPTLTIEPFGEGAEVLPRNEDNLIWTTASRLYWEMTGSIIPPGHITVSSQIPLSRGLGSSAAAVVAGLLLANALLPEPLSMDRLLHTATAIEGHPDNVAAALFGGFVLVYRDRNSVIRVNRYTPPALTSLLAIPAYPVPTKDSRAILPPQVSRDDAIFNAQRVALWIHAVSQNDWSVLRDAADDRLHQPYRTVLVEGLDELIRASYDAGAFAATLSGSGPTVMALTDSEHAPAIEKAWQDLASNHHWPLTIRYAQPIAEGAQVQWVDNIKNEAAVADE